MKLADLAPRLVSPLGLNNRDSDRWSEPRDKSDAAKKQSKWRENNPGAVRRLNRICNIRATLKRIESGKYRHPEKAAELRSELAELEKKT